VCYASYQVLEIGGDQDGGDNLSGQTDNEYPLTGTR
jgi:hypothetical protein